MTGLKPHVAGIPVSEIKIGDRVTVGYINENRSAIVVNVCRDAYVTSDGSAHFVGRHQQIEVYSRCNPIPQQ